MVDAVSGAVDIALTGGKALLVRGYSRASVQSKFTGTLTGVVNFWFSNDPSACDKDGNILDTTKFVAMPSRPAAYASQDPAGSAGGGYYGFADLAAAWLAATYAHTSGAGNLTLLGAANR